MSMFNAEQQDYLRDRAQAKRNDNAPGPRRAAAFAAFLELVTEYGTARIVCDLAACVSAPGDIVSILVESPLGREYDSGEIEFEVGAIHQFSDYIQDLYEADAALLVGGTP